MRSSCTLPTSAPSASSLVTGVSGLGVAETGTEALPASKLLPGERMGALALPGDGAASQPMPGASRVGEETGVRVLPGMDAVPKTLLAAPSRATNSEGDVCFAAATPL